MQQSVLRLSHSVVMSAYKFVLSALQWEDTK